MFFRGNGIDRACKSKNLTVENLELQKCAGFESHLLQKYHFVKTTTNIYIYIYIYHFDEFLTKVGDHHFIKRITCVFSSIYAILYIERESLTLISHA